MTPEIHARIVDEIMDGASPRQAAQAAGLSDTTMRKWMRRGGADEEPYAALWRDITAVLTAQGPRDPKAAVRRRW